MGLSREMIRTLLLNGQFSQNMYLKGQLMLERSIFLDPFICLASTIQRLHAIHILSLIALLSAPVPAFTITGPPPGIHAQSTATTAHAPDPPLAAVKAGDRLSPEEVTTLLQQRHLFQDAHHCPHGRPTALVFTSDELDKRFKRM